MAARRQLFRMWWRRMRLPAPDPPPSCAAGALPGCRRWLRPTLPTGRLPASLPSPLLNRQATIAAPMQGPAPSAAAAGNGYAVASSTRVLDIGGEERRGRAVDVAQADAVPQCRREVIVPYRLRRVIERLRPVLDAQIRDHAVLLDTVARDPDAANEHVAAVDWEAARKDLQAVGQLGLAARNDGQNDAGCQGKGGVQPDKGATLWRGRPPFYSLWEIGPRQNPPQSRREKGPSGERQAK